MNRVWKVQIKKIRAIEYSNFKNFLSKPYHF